MQPLSNAPPGLGHAVTVPAGEQLPDPDAAAAPAAAVGLAPRFARQPARPASAERQAEAARTIARGYRGHVASKTQSAMVSSGTIWQGVEADLRQRQVLNAGERLTIERLSSINMAALRLRLASFGGPLNGTESAFVERFLQQRFWATHFTTASLLGSSEQSEPVSMLSGRRLIERGIEYSQTNTTLLDKLYKSDQDHVFFALECGDKPQKTSSRFGSNVYRVPFETVAASSPGVWGALDDILTSGEDVDVERAIPSISSAEEAFAVGVLVGSGSQRDQSNADCYRDVFSGEHLREAAALSLVTKFRQLRELLHSMTGADPTDQVTPQPLVDSFLASSTPDEFNTLLHTLHRIEIRVPRRLSTADFVHFDAVMLDWLKEPHATAVEPGADRLQSLVAFCSGTPADAERKLGMLCEAGIDVRAIRSDQGGSLLHLLCANVATASAQHKQAILSLIPALLDFGLAVDHPDANGASPLAYARHDADMLRVLLAQGAELPAQVDEPDAELSGSATRKAS